ncbi:MAG: hypothetical protein SAK29_37960 [Scytonema sp. PMC 1069.18]|nr:hypothetical protein [Scytonema sp. PMC 1069.18]
MIDSKLLVANLLLIVPIHLNSFRMLAYAMMNYERLIYKLEQIRLIEQ